MDFETTEETMIEIGDTLVSLDVAERYFCCDFEKCKGACCIEGDAGAPITRAERRELKKVLPAIEHLLSPKAKDAIKQKGESYIDEDGDLVTQIVDGRDCVFTCRGADGCCLCAVERGWEKGVSKIRKPESCALYPIRLKQYDGFMAVNYHRWEICRDAEILGEKLGIRVYQFLERPLRERFGDEWYEALAEACEAWNNR